MVNENFTQLCKKWVIACKHKDFQPMKNSFLCSEHFKSEDYALANSTRLKPNAKPSVNFPGHLLNQEPLKRKHLSDRHHVNNEEASTSKSIETPPSTSKKKVKTSPTKEELHMTINQSKEKVCEKNIK